MLVFVFLEKWRRNVGRVTLLNRPSVLLSAPINGLGWSPDDGDSTDDDREARFAAADREGGGLVVIRNRDVYAEGGIVKLISRMLFGML